MNKITKSPPEIKSSAWKSSALLLTLNHLLSVLGQETFNSSPLTSTSQYIHTDKKIKYQSLSKESNLSLLAVFIYHCSKTSYIYRYPTNYLQKNHFRFRAMECKN